MVSIEEIARFCKRKGFVYPNSEIYGGMAGFFDYGPLGCEMKNNIKQEWWKTFVTQREDIVGIDGSIITHPDVWVASGHVGNFADLMITCKKCREKIRADHFLEEKLGIAADGISAAKINSLISEHDLKCPACGGDFKDVEDFNLMFSTHVGPKKDSESIAYLRPETAQIIFANFKLVYENARLKLPFGIAQMGKSFRNEISPRNFLFRCREFEQMEIEYFTHPKHSDKCPFISEMLDYEILVYDASMQKDGDDAVMMSMRDALAKNIIKTEWHAYWLASSLKWFEGLGAKKENFRIRQHVDTEKSHYALDTWDLDYRFPFGWKELQGIANRTDFDLKQHIKHSKADLSVYDEESKEKIVPYVVCEPSLGVDRAFLVFMFDAYTTRKDEKGKDVVVLKIHPKLAPYKAAIYPLVNKLTPKAREVYEQLRCDLTLIFDKSGSIGRRYARADETGIPYCITVDFDSLEDDTVTIRDRDSTAQVRVKTEELEKTLRDLISGKAKFSEL